MYKVAIKGKTMFLKKGKAEESPCEGVYWLVSSIDFAMNTLCIVSSLARMVKSIKVSQTNSSEPVL